MINEAEAIDLLLTYKNLKSNYETNKNLNTLRALRQHEKICINKFDYIIHMKLNKYRKFHNYEDLYQEGKFALFRSMNTYDVNKGSFFWWAHKYIGTKIKRSANLHTAIRVPLKEANKTTPHKEYMLPILIEENWCPDKMAEKSETFELIRDSLNTLNDTQKTVISLIYGIDSGNPTTVSKICDDLKITRVQCLSIMKNALSKMRGNLLYKI